MKAKQLTHVEAHIKEISYRRIIDKTSTYLASDQKNFIKAKTAEMQKELAEQKLIELKRIYDWNITFEL